MLCVRKIMFALACACAFMIGLLYQNLSNHNGKIHAKNEFKANQENMTNIQDLLINLNVINLTRPSNKCPPYPPNLMGPKVAQLLDLNKEPNFDDIAVANPKLSHGGGYFPGECQARYKVAMIIPFRNREIQLRGFLSHMHPIWQRQQIDYKVYTITQDGDGIFNKGILMNAGFVEAAKDREFDCYVFHDVDLLSENDECLYWCNEVKAKNKVQVVHMVTFMDKFQYKLLRYEPPCLPANYRMGTITYFGGITMFTRDQFLEINGFSNIFWGWGGEDDDVVLRVRRKGYVIRREAKCHYRMYKHKGAGKNSTNNMAYRILNSAFKRQDVDGLNSLRYKVISREETAIFTNITIDVGSPSNKMMELYNDPHEREKCDGDVFLHPDVW